MPINMSGVKVLKNFVNRELPSKIEATAREIATFALERAVDISPFASGQFAASWRISVGEPTNEYAMKGQRTPGGARSEALAASTPALKQIKLGTQFSISNAAPHAEYVEYGAPTIVAHYITRRVASAVGGKFGKI